VVLDADQSALSGDCCVADDAFGVPLLDSIPECPLLLLLAFRSAVWSCSFVIWVITSAPSDDVPSFLKDEPGQSKRTSRYLGFAFCQDFEFPVLLVLLYVRVASLFYIERVGPILTRLRQCSGLPLRVWFLCGTPYFNTFGVEGGGMLSAVAPGARRLISNCGIFERGASLLSTSSPSSALSSFPLWTVGKVLALVSFMGRSRELVGLVVTAEARLYDRLIA
jgi:hypothetical protein